jgi:hypothetical protein
MSKRLIPPHHAAASFASIAVIAECIITKKERVVAVILSIDNNYL